VLFWDVDIQTINYRKHAPYVVERVLTRGTLQDFLIINAYYGKRRMKSIAKKLRFLDERTLRFCSAYFDIPIQDFRCYTNKQLSQTHWNY
jgi:hypothetical protein